MTSASIIIATYNRAGLLDGCLAHLRGLQFEPSDEVIVVDNGSTDATATVIGRHAQSFPVPLRHLEERRPGKSHALASALRIARGDIWAFTDDDVEVGPEWLTALRDVFIDPSVALVGGPVAPRWETPAPRWLSTGAERTTRLLSPLALIDYGPTRCALGERTLLGANLAIRHEVMRRMGGFSTDLGKLRGTLLSGEDHDLCRRVQAAGLSAVYTPRAIVHHWVPRHRMRLGYFLAWFYWSGVTLAVLDSTEPRPSRRVLGVPAYLARRLAWGLVGVPSAAACGEPGEAIERVIDVAFVVGYAARQWGLAPASTSQRAGPRADLERPSVPDGHVPVRALRHPRE